MKPEARNLYNQHTKGELAGMVVLYRVALKTSIEIFHKIAVLTNNNEVLSLVAELDAELKKLND